MKPLHRISAIGVLVAFGYCVPLVLAVDSYRTSGRAYVQASKLPPVTHDWLLTLDQARTRGVKYARK